MKVSKSKSKKSEKGLGSKDEVKQSESKSHSGGGVGGGGGESPAATPGQGGPSHHQHHPSNPGGAGATTLTSPGGTTATAQAMKTSASPGHSFISEIQQMMHGFGDCRKPLPESAALVEEIVHQQMVSLLYQASDVAGMRNARFVGIEDFLFLLRKDEVKLRRLIKYLAFKDKAASLKAGAGIEDDDAEASEGKQGAKKKRKLCYDFLNSIDQTGELVALFEDEAFDEVKQERALRADEQSRQMDAQQYMDYCEARQTSFTAQKFKEWVMSGLTLDLKPSQPAMRVLSYLAYETVAQIVDLALIVKRDTSGSIEDPFTPAMPPVCQNYDTTISNMEAKAQAAAAPNRSPSRTGSPPTSTPPTTPTAPSPMTSTPGGGMGTSTTSTGGSVSSTSTSSKSKSKKRKKSESAAKELYYQPIQPKDIREALRRNSQAIGPFADFSKSPMISPKNKILCC